MLASSLNKLNPDADAGKQDEGGQAAGVRRAVVGRKRGRVGTDRGASQTAPVVQPR